MLLTKKISKKINIHRPAIKILIFILIYFLIAITFTSTAFSDESPENMYLETKVVLFPIQETVVSSLVDSFITAIRFKEGDEFRKGDILIELDNSLYKQSNIIAKAKLIGTEASLKYAESIFINNKKMLEIVNELEEPPITEG